jgi:SP family arabinose:H+ symporter-like MFS transporter
MNGRLLTWTVIAAFAGFLFGFDTVVISGAEQSIQLQWHLSPGMHGVAIASALYGTVFGSLFGGWPTDRIGRRATLLLIGAFYLIGALGSALATDVYSFAAARALGGLGIGISTVVAPLYISEISPPKHRGRLAGMFQFNIVFGILIAYLSNSLLAAAGPNAWRWMLGVAAFPSLGFSLACLSLPESPRWLIARKNDAQGALRVLRLLRPGVSRREIAAEAAAISGSSADLGVAATFWSRRLRLPIVLAISIAFFNQLSGINAILYFAPRIFEMTGLGAKAALLQSTGIGAANLLFTFIGLWLIDRLGRRTLLYIGSVGYIASLGLVSWAFFTAHYGIVPICIFAFIAAHAVGQGAVIWVFIAEIFPNMQRARGQALGSFTHWFFAALLTTIFPRMVSAFAPGYVFAFFAGMMVLQLIWVRLLVIETKGASLEDIQQGMSAGRC